MSIQSAIYGRLNDSTITNLAAIYYEEPPTNSALPFLVYDLDEEDPINSMAGHSGTGQWTLTVDHWTKSQANQTSLTAAVLARLAGYHGGSVLGIFFKGDDSEKIGDETEGDEYHATLTFTVWYSGAAVVSTSDATGTVTTGTNSVTLAACSHSLTLDCSGLTLDGGAVLAAAGSNSQVQYNNNGVFGGAAGFTYNSTTHKVSITPPTGTDVDGLLSVTHSDGNNVFKASTSSYQVYIGPTNTNGFVFDGSSKFITVPIGVECRSHNYARWNQVNPTITTDAANNTPLVVQLLGSQSADAFQIKSNSGTTVFRINNSGRIDPDGVGTSGASDGYILTSESGVAQWMPPAGSFNPIDNGTTGNVNGMVYGNGSAINSDPAITSDGSANLTVGGSLTVGGGVTVAGLTGWSGTFATGDSRTATVTGGVITDVS